MILIDADHLSVLTEPRDARQKPLLARMRQKADVALPIVVVEEHLRGWLAQLRRVADVTRQVVPYTRLVKSIEFFRHWEIVNWSDSAARIFTSLRKSRIRIGTEDLKIASMALADDALLLSANLRDFERVPGLRVEDWLR
jgi:tRNA(fMet)-specific endonuclease VapC